MVISPKKIFVVKREIKEIFKDVRSFCKKGEILSIEFYQRWYEMKCHNPDFDAENLTELKDITEYFINTDDVGSAERFLDGLGDKGIFYCVIPLIRKSIKSGTLDEAVKSGEIEMIYFRIPTFVCSILNELDILKDWIKEQHSTEPNKANNKNVQKNIQQINRLTKVQSERMVKYFKIAIDEGLITESDNSYTWNDSKVKLAYFIHKVFNYDGVQRIPYKTIQELFNVERLDSAVDKAITTKEPQKWRSDIDRIFKD